MWPFRIKTEFVEKRHTQLDLDSAKFSTQKCVTYIILILFSLMSISILGDSNSDQSERSMILQTIINLVLLATGYWLGSSKQAADTTAGVVAIAKPQAESQSRIAEGAPPGDVTAGKVDVTADSVVVNKKAKGK